MGKAIEEGKQLRERLSANFNELVVACLATKEAKGAWDEEKNQASEWVRRAMASYKESEGFQCDLRHSSQATYEFGC